MPALSKVWYSSNNHALDDTSTAARVAASVLFALKATLMGQVSGTDGPEGARPAGSYWTLYGSSDGSTYGIDSTDRIGSTFNAAKWVRVAAGGTPHTWFVLQSPAGLADGPWYLCVDYIGATDAAFSIGIARQPFSGGSPSTSARPTASPESFYTAQTFNDATANPGKTHFATDANGAFYFHMSRNGTGFTQLTIGVQQMTETRASDGARCVLLCLYDNSSPGSMGFTTTGQWKGIKYDNTGTIDTNAGRLIMINFAASTWIGLQTNTNANDAKLDAFPIAYLHDGTASHIGVRGRLPDVWLTSHQVSPGSAIPSTGAQVFTQLGGCFLPCSVALSL